jgi:hypothetical protein
VQFRHHSTREREARQTAGRVPELLPDAPRGARTLLADVGRDLTQVPQRSV